MADAYSRAIGDVSFRGLLDAISPTPIVGDAISGLLGLYDTGKGLLGDYKAAQEKDPRKMIRGMAANTDNYNSGLLNLGSILPYVTPAVAGMFIGKNSKVWDALKADEAQKMLAAGVDPKEVWKKTGTFKGVDGALRQEIDDSGAQIKSVSSLIKSRNDDLAKSRDEIIKAAGKTPTNEQKFAVNNINQLMQTSSYRGDIGDAVTHSELFNSYPYLQNREFRWREMPNGEWGQWGSDGLTLNIGKFGDDAKSTTLHELQHAIQEREGWARGGSPSDMTLILEDEAKKLRSEAKRLFELSSNNDPLNPQIIKPGARKKGLELERKARDYEEQVARIQNFGIGFDSYKKLAGEAEARLTQSRMNMTMPERLQVYPYDMLDVPQEQLIVRGLLGDAPTTAMSVAPTKYEQAHEVARQTQDTRPTWWHGSPADIYKDGGWFKLSEGESGVPAVWGTSDPLNAEGYARGEVDSVLDESRKLPIVKSWYKDYDGNGGVYALKSKASNPFEYDAGGQQWFRVPQGSIMRDAQQKGHDAVVFKNIIDSYQPGGLPSDVIAWFDTNAFEKGRVNPELLPWLTGAGLLGSGGMYYSGE